MASRRSLFTWMEDNDDGGILPIFMSAAFDFIFFMFSGTGMGTCTFTFTVVLVLWILPFSSFGICEDDEEEDGWASSSRGLFLLASMI